MTLRTIANVCLDMMTKKFEYDWELSCTGCNEKYFKVRGKTGRKILAKCKNCSKVANVKKMKIKRAN
jgi:hypothetical protein